LGTWPFYLEDRTAHRADSKVNKTGPFSRAIQKLSRFVALPFYGGNLAVYVFDVLANIERVPVKFFLQLTALSSKAK
jgi:hypothetical protein